MIKSENTYKNFWQEVKQKIKIASLLDKDNNLVLGAETHRYKIYPPVEVKDILAFEAKNKIELPLNYRTYLQYFGAYGAGPDDGTCDFYGEIITTDVHKTSPIKKFKHPKTNIEVIPRDKYPISQTEGLIKIGADREPECCYLVINGALKGEVLGCSLYEYFDYSEGSLEEWYSTWIDRIIIKLKNYHLFSTLTKDMNLEQIEEILKVKATICSENPHSFSEHKIICFKNTPGTITLDKNGSITNIRKVSSITAGATNCADYQ